ncbi:hypothetical protein PILCRDRAFT_612919 [Piloderma croceum F 1598]|uniref:Uncharacterized protein n=1 Tax=Piloderma croceum (strain F 1598) TaxID=765440 RepID=A0A0C3AUU1_PILCF|nr:hypothetical protein PILCRDRAFT_612919 [Piloderma croceum F 1598]
MKLALIKHLIRSEPGPNRFLLGIGTQEGLANLFGRMLSQSSICGVRFTRNRAAELDVGYHSCLGQTFHFRCTTMVKWKDLLSNLLALAIQDVVTFDTC